LPAYFKQNKKYFKPEEIIRYKQNLSLSIQGNLFVDAGLLPALEKEASARIDFLIGSLLSNIQDQIGQNEYENFLKIVFNLLTAKLIKDKGIDIDQNIDFENPLQVLKIVKRYYNNSLNFNNISVDIIKEISDSINNSISFNNLSVDTLTFIYENTLVSPLSRKKWGIHSTPSYLADYLVSKIPLDNRHYNSWKFYDPMCGHGILLIAAMRKLRSLLPIEWSGKKRHDYYIHSLLGTEIDAFSVEVAKMCLTLADFPETNGWDVTKADIFKGHLLEDNIKTTTVLIANPPFENEKIGDISTPKPKHLMERSLIKLPKNSYVAIILPRAFLDSGDYRGIRENILSDYQIIDITNLPANVFSHSATETSIIVLKKSIISKNYYFKYNTINKEDLKKFRTNYSITWSENAYQEKLKNQFVIPYLANVWDHLKNNSVLEDIAKINLGVQNEPTKVTPAKDYKKESFKNSVQAIVNAKECLMQYYYENNYFIPSSPSLRRRNAWELDWESTKVFVPAGRLSSGPWKFAAIIDYEKRYVTRNFFAIWPKSGLCVEVISAILNSPVANAYIYSFTSGTSIPKRYYSNIPIPDIINLKNNSERIKSIVTEYITNIKEENFDKAYETLLTIDAEILKLYDLPPKFEKILLDIFWGKNRQVPFVFDKYFPKNFDSYIPLHIYISDKYKTSTIKEFVNNFPTIEKNSIKFLLELNS
jgi:type I restriction-modification system DNA methylase subunit